MEKIVKKDEGTVIEVLSDRHVIKLRGEDTENRISIIEQTYLPQTGSMVHSHIADTHVFYVLEGIFQMTLGKVEREMLQGDLAYIPHGVWHGFKAIGPTTGKALVLTFPAGLENLFIALSKMDLEHGKMDIAKTLDQYGVRIP